MKLLVPVLCVLSVVLLGGCQQEMDRIAYNFDPRDSNAINNVSERLKNPASLIGRISHSRLLDWLGSYVSDVICYSIDKQEQLSSGKVQITFSTLIASHIFAIQAHYVRFEKIYG